MSGCDEQNGSEGFHLQKFVRDKWSSAHQHSMSRNSLWFMSFNPERTGSMFIATRSGNPPGTAERSDQLFDRATNDPSGRGARRRDRQPVSNRNPIINCIQPGSAEADRFGQAR
jgi:hypothetical protein